MKLRKLLIILIVLFVNLNIFAKDEEIDLDLFEKKTKSYLNIDFVDITTFNIGLGLQQYFSKQDQGHFYFGLNSSINPLEYTIGANFNLTSPMNLISLSASYDYIFVLNGYEFNGINDDMSSKTLDKKKKEKGRGHKVSLGLEITKQLGRLYFSYSVDFSYLNYNLGKYFYNPTHDLIQNDGWLLECQINPLIIIYPKIYVGPYLSMTYLFENEYTKIHSGLAVVLDEIPLLSNHDSLVFNVGYWIKEKFRKNENEGFTLSFFYRLTFEL